MEVGSSIDGIVGEDVEGVDCELNKDRNESIEPKVGMKFDSVEDLHSLFKSYARLKEFGIRKRSSTKDEDGVSKYVRFACSREGNRESKSSNPLKPRPMSRTGCKVLVSARFQLDGKWQIINVCLDHNHEISPSKSHLFRCNREISQRVKNQRAINDQTGIDVPKNLRSLVEEAGGYDEVPFIQKDARNFVEKMRRLRLGEGDAIAIRNYFLKMQGQNSSFFFNIDLDVNGRLKNVFWADARSRKAYKEFGDVVTFDTTYLTNKYDIPFAPFVGVNHHGQLILLGCGFVSHEDTDTFVWLFSTWLACMDGCAPQGIITDQDRAIQNAIAIVFPNTKHRWCLWHILKKLPEKFSGNDSNYHSIKYALHGCVYDSQRPEEFEKSWSEMLDKYELQDNSWLSGLYDERRLWVPCYVKTSFWAGMSTTQPSECMNAFFDGYVNHKTTLKQFVERYDSVVRCKIEKEAQEDFRSFSKTIPVTSSFEMEKQVQSAYTISKFKEFQNELNSQMYCRIVSTRKEGTTSVYEIKERIVFGEGKKNVIFTVSYKSDEGEIECSCHMFEYKGTLCKHVIYVLVENEVELLPEKYILHRWRKDVRRPHTRIIITDNGWVVTPEQKRYDEMCIAVTEIADLAAMDEEDSREVMEWVSHQKNKLTKRKSRSGSNNPSPITSSSLKPRKIIYNEEDPRRINVQDPEVSKI